jgi:hypothetical protein
MRTSQTINGGTNLTVQRQSAGRIRRPTAPRADLHGLAVEERTVGGIVRLQGAVGPRTHHEAREVHDPPYLVGQAFHRFLELARCSDQEAAQWMNHVTRTDHVRPVHISRWATGRNSPPADYFLIALWLAGQAGLDVLSDVLKL